MVYRQLNPGWLRIDAVNGEVTLEVAGPRGEVKLTLPTPCAIDLIFDLARVTEAAQEQKAHERETPA